MESAYRVQTCYFEQNVQRIAKRFGEHHKLATTIKARAVIETHTSSRAIAFGIEANYRAKLAGNSLGQSMH